MGFIEEFAGYVQKHAPDYEIKVHSPIIAQAILESAKGISDKVMKVRSDGTVEWRHNYLGLKWRNNRCAISNEYFEEKTSEQNPDGSYRQIVDRFCKFNSMEDCVIGYFQWTNIARYSNLKGVTDPRTYLENIKADGYATSIDYVENLMRVIESYNLTKYDSVKGENKMVFNIHAGHNPDGMVACGAIGFIKESTENRNVKNEVIRMLRGMGHTAYDCTVDNGTSKSNVLKNIVAKCNAHTVDLDVSIHFNAGAKDGAGNGKTTGTEVFIYKDNNKAEPYAKRVVGAIGDLGFKIRDDAIKDDVKTASYLYVLKNTKAPAMLIECCFVDDKDDVALYDFRSMARAIVYGLTGQYYNEVVEGGADAEIDKEDNSPENKDALYRVQVGAYSKKTNAEAMMKKLKDAGFDAVIVKA